MTQTDRLVTYLRTHPGATSLDIVRDVHIINTTGRVSDARKEGHVIDCRRDERGLHRYYLVEQPVQLTLGDVA